MKLIRFFSVLMVMILGAVSAQAQSDYVIRTGDVLQVEVLEDPSLDRAVSVLPNGQISFPFAGTIQAGGRTIEQMQASIRDAISSNFAVPPTVFVGVQPTANSRSASSGKGGRNIDVYFIGEVNNPGMIEVKRGTSLLQAVAVSGGVSRFAAVKRIQLRRTDPRTGVQKVTILNYKALSDGAITTDIELKDGDVILVPERRLFE